MNQEPIIVERVFKAPAERVWKALTDLEEMKQWYFEIDAFLPVLGFEFRFDGQNEGRIFRHRCRITQLEPGSKLAYSWQYEGYPGISFVHFELYPEGNHSRLKLTHEGVESFPQDSPDFQRKNFEYGWDSIINTSLAQFVE